MSTTIVITNDPEEAASLIARVMRPAAASAIAAAPSLPAVPKAELTEHYAGIAFVDGKPSHHLFLLEAKSNKKMAWKEAVAWAEGLGDGVSLPTRFESALLYANLRDQFDTGPWYWTGEQYSAQGAWGQGFDYGSQGTSDKSYEGLARAVRRLPL